MDRTGYRRPSPRSGGGVIEVEANYNKLGLLPIVGRIVAVVVPLPTIVAARNSRFRE
jgi:hypothetical protein